MSPPFGHHATSIPSCLFIGSFPQPSRTAATQPLPVKNPPSFAIPSAPPSLPVLSALFRSQPQPAIFSSFFARPERNNSFQGACYRTKHAQIQPSNQTRSTILTKPLFPSTGTVLPHTAKSDHSLQHSDHRPPPLSWSSIPVSISSE